MAEKLIMVRSSCKSNFTLNKSSLLSIFYQLTKTQQTFRDNAPLDAQLSDKVNVINACTSSTKI